MDIAKLRAALQEALAALDTVAAPTPDPVPAGFVRLSVTGHILPVPADADASLWGYLLRAGEAAGIPAGSRSMRAANQAYGLAGDDRSRWPEAVDRVGNWESYATPAEIAARRAAEEAAAAQIGSPNDPFLGRPRPKPPTLPGVGSE